MTNILGINAYHGDSSACLVIDGELVAAAEEERFRRIKHWAGLPSEAIRYCLSEAGLSLSDLNAIAINQDSKANLGKKIGFTLSKRPDLKFILDKIKNRREREGLDDQLLKLFPGQSFNGKLIPVEHHLAHLSSAFHVSPFDEAVVVSVDGFGDFASAAWGVGHGTDIDIDDRVFFPHSLGNFYQALTQYLGFPHYGDEYKVMGLAPYGKPVYLEQLKQVVLLQADGGYRLNMDFFRHHKENIVYEWDNGVPVFGQIFSNKLIELLGPVRDKDEELRQRHFDIAHSVQAMYETAFFHLLNTLYKTYGFDKLALAGGCAMNSVANGKIVRNTPFKQVYVQSAAGDAGGAIGAAMVAWFQMVDKTNYPSPQPSPLKGERGKGMNASSVEGERGIGASNLEGERGKGRFVMDHAYWGPAFTNEEIGKVLEVNQAQLKDQNISMTLISDEQALCAQTARAIADGKVIGWFQGRMEWGPRALGNRSILCDPRRADMKELLNQKIKRRESFRPFAPSILREAVSGWFEEDDDVPFMMKVFQIRPGKRELIPAVTHVDGSGRLQTVTLASNPRYYKLIKAFQVLTDIPVLLNTSFNENEPVVCRPQEALDCFLRTRMDMLVCGDYMLERRK